MSTLAGFALGSIFGAATTVFVIGRRAARRQRDRLAIANHLALIRVLSRP